MGIQGKPPGPSPARRLTLVAVVAALLGSTVLAVVLFASAGDDPGDDGLRTADGVVTEIGDARMTLRLNTAIDGREQLEMAIEPDGASEKLDLEHLTFHAASGNPMRIWFERRGDEYVACEAIDLPGLR